jgi:hypothetical protein
MGRMPENDEVDSLIESAYNSEKAKENALYDSHFKAPRGTVASSENISLYCSSKKLLNARIGSAVPSI